MATSGSLTPEVVNQFRTSFLADPRNKLAQNICTYTDPIEACISRKVVTETQHVFTNKIEEEGKPVTDQRTSSRCWIFATLNVMRIPFIKHHDLEEFEFSQAYVYFWDKIERYNYFLHNIVEVTKRGEPVTGRLMSFLLSDPTNDGGQWDMIVNIIKRYGLVPKACFPESFSSECSPHMNSLLKSKLREYAKVLRELVESGVSDEKIEEKIQEQLAVLYRILGICLGIPPETFTWEYYDKSKNYKCIGPIKPTEFYEKYVKPYFNIDDKVCLVTDPRSLHPYGFLYTVDCLGNVVGGRRTLYNNQPPELLMKLCVESIKNNEPVWFGSDAFARFLKKDGICDIDCYDMKDMFGTDIHLGFSKADRLTYGESGMNHAMVFTAVSIDEDDKVKKFRVENSWGEEYGNKGYFTLTADWFMEYVFEIVVDKRFVPADVLAVFEQEPVTLPAWDPMGTLAQ